jgi:glycine/D-amino acid oxidase-like deaminating enzyme
VNLEDAKTTPLWWDAIEARVIRPSLAGDRSVDVAIVGAGLTGLWTAYYLAGVDPGLQILVIDQHHVGFGASGRNGGWCHAQYPLGIPTLAKDHGVDLAVRHMRALFATVDEVHRVTEAEGIDCQFQKGGVFDTARSPLHLQRAHEQVEEYRAAGLGPDHMRFLGADEAREVMNATNTLGGTWSPHGAALQPALLTHGLAAACERRGVTILEATPATDMASGRIVTPYGTITAEMIVRATEGFTARLPRLRRRMAPLYSHMIATAPLSDDVWEQIGLHDRPTFGDFRNLIIYGQRTADGRLAFGGRGAPYHFGSSIDDSYDAHDAVHTEIARVLLELFPQLEGTEITHRWGGALGAPRDWRPSVSIDRGRKVAWAGGYVGDGVNTTNLAGRTLADLICERETDLTTLPWVQHEWRNWEPEPLRWIGINAGLWMARQADASEERTGAPSRLGALGNWLRGKTR